MIAVAVLDDHERLFLFAAPDWKSVVPSETVREIDELFRGFAENSDFHPLALFKQLCSLNQGLLVTVGVLTEAELPRRFAGFVPM